MSASLLPVFAFVIFCLPSVEGREGDPVERIGIVAGPGTEPDAVSVSLFLTAADLADAEQMQALQEAGYVAKGGVPVAAVPSAVEGEGPGTFRRPANFGPDSTEV